MLTWAYFVGFAFAIVITLYLFLLGRMVWRGYIIHRRITREIDKANERLRERNKRGCRP